MKLTKTGAAIGTPHYLSPEQARGDRETDGRTDVWAMGAVLFEMLSGRTLFDGASANLILAQVVNVSAGVGVVPRLAGVAPWVPRELAEVVQRAIEPDLARRYPTMNAFHDALNDVRERLTTGPTIPEAGPPREVVVRGAPRQVQIALGVLGVLGVGALVAFGLSLARERPVSGVVRPAASVREPAPVVQTAISAVRADPPAPPVVEPTPVTAPPVTGNSVVPASVATPRPSPGGQRAREVRPRLQVGGAYQ